ncbi:MAG: V-type ATP synthase subunit D [Gammaproteobacteria bacterium]|nr:V-type ATP synthase subunit D [Gammaproteobacteria bacterium]
MEDRLNLAPTKSNLLALRQQVDFLDEGYQLLERKREMLTRLVYSKLKEYQALKHQAHLSLRQAYRSLSITQMRMGTQRIRQLALGMPPAIKANILPRRNMGVQYPSVDISPNPLQPVGILGTDVSLDKTRKDFSQMAVQMAKLAELESALWRLLEEQRKTQKRVNALKYNIIPRYQRSISFIENTLEEEERDALFQLKVLQQRA